MDRNITFAHPNGFTKIVEREYIYQYQRKIFA